MASLQCQHLKKPLSVLIISTEQSYMGKWFLWKRWVAAIPRQCNENKSMKVWCLFLTIKIFLPKILGKKWTSWEEGFRQKGRWNKEGKRQAPFCRVQSWEVKEFFCIFLCLKATHLKCSHLTEVSNNYNLNLLLHAASEIRVILENMKLFFWSSKCILIVPDVFRV